MSEIDIQQPGRNVKRWQRFLCQQRLLTQAHITGHYDTETVQATHVYQQAQNIAAKQPGILDSATLHRAKSQGFQTEFEIGPDKKKDIRLNRPYFLVPLLELVPHDDFAETRHRIVEHVGSKPVSDIYILSHGWHRNFFAGVEAYDRLISRFSALFDRGRLTPIDPQTYYPLFLTLHWHSDPAEDGWVDKEGRRHKASFIANARAAFSTKPGIEEAQFLNDFEDIFAFFSNISAPDVAALSDALDHRASALLEILDSHYEIKGRVQEPPADRSDKATLAWACYDEALTRRVLGDQSEKPGRYNSPLQSVAVLLQFVIAAVGITAVLGLLPRLWRELQNFAWIRSIESHATTTMHLFPIWGWLGIAFLTLLATAGWHQRQQEDQATLGWPWLALIAWLPVQIVCTVPMLAYAVCTYFFHFFNIGVFSERVRYRPDGTPQNEAARPRDLLAALARFPLRLLQSSVSKDSAILGLTDAMDSQFAFWEMQRKAVNAGQQAGEFLANLIGDSEALHGARLHFIGHSFGGLVVVNAGRYLARLQNRLDINLRTLCLLQAALASDWFDGEVALTAKIEGALACIYSAYDTANGFYYPFANNSRIAAGYTGLYRIGPGTMPTDVGKGGLFAMLVEPPDLAAHLPPNWNGAVNLDASRLIYGGNVAAGGGHDEIYKDDVIHLIWAVTQLRQAEGAGHG